MRNDFPWRKGDTPGMKAWMLLYWLIIATLAASVVYSLCQLALVLMEANPG